MSAENGEMAITDDELFNTIVQLRKTVTPFRGMDYINHVKGKLSVIPPDSIMDKREADYRTMRGNMIICESLKWNELLVRIKGIEGEFNTIKNKSN